MNPKLSDALFQEKSLYDAHGEYGGGYADWALKLEAENQRLRDDLAQAEMSALLLKHFGPLRRRLSYVYNTIDINTPEKLWRWFTTHVPKPEKMPNFLGENHAMWEERDVVKFIARCICDFEEIILLKNKVKNYISLQENVKTLLHCIKSDPHSPRNVENYCRQALFLLDKLPKSI